MVAGRDQPRHGLAVLGDDNSIGVCPVEEGQALFLEFRGGDGFHGHILQLVINYVHFLERLPASKGGPMIKHFLKPHP